MKTRPCRKHPPLQSTPASPAPADPGSAPGAATPRRTFRLPPEFQSLTREQIDYINDQLRSKTYAEVQEILLTHCGIRISINKLFRYYQKLQFAEQLEIAEDSPEAVEELLKIYNGQPVDIDKAGFETIKRRALELAVAPSTKPRVLVDLMRIFTWEHRKSMDEHRKKADVKKETTRDRLATVAERRAKSEEDRVKLLERHQAFLENHHPRVFQPPTQYDEKMLKTILGELYQPPEERQ